MNGPHRLLTHDKSFADPWVGSGVLNALGLHPARMMISDAVLGLRRLQTLRKAESDHFTDLQREGVVVLANFLPHETFLSLQKEVDDKLDTANEMYPAEANCEQGFGRRRPFPGGFDRWDGGTRNRFVDIHQGTTPECHSLVQESRLRSLCETGSGYRYRPEKFFISEIVNGDEKQNPDDQKLFHRDTFHSCLKAWFFTAEVREQDGPFSYVKGSQRLSQERLGWEFRRSREASKEGSDGSFRISVGEISEMGLPRATSYPVAANTLVVADVRGFHRRGDAHPGTRRRALHASFRPSPFVPFPY